MIFKIVPLFVSVLVFMQGIGRSERLGSCIGGAQTERKLADEYVCILHSAEKKQVKVCRTEIKGVKGQ